MVTYTRNEETGEFVARRIPFSQEKFNEFKNYIAKMAIDERHLNASFGAGGVFVRDPSSKKSKETSILLSHLGTGCTLAFQSNGGEIMVFTENIDWMLVEMWAEDLQEGETVKITDDVILLHTPFIEKRREGGGELINEPSEIYPRGTFQYRNI